MAVLADCPPSVFEELTPSLSPADALVAADLVRREPDPEDARAVRVVLTARGRREHKVRYERFLRALERLSDDLSEVERRQLADALETLGRLFAEPEPQARASSGRPKS